MRAWDWLNLVGVLLVIAGGAYGLWTVRKPHGADSGNTTWDQVENLARDQRRMMSAALLGASLQLTALVWGLNSA